MICCRRRQVVLINEWRWEGVTGCPKIPNGGRNFAVSRGLQERPRRAYLVVITRAFSGFRSPLVEISTVTSSGVDMCLLWSVRQLGWPLLLLSLGAMCIKIRVLVITAAYLAGSRTASAYRALAGRMRTCLLPGQVVSAARNRR